jgi:NADH-quinone oxidoreductase subunit F
MRICAPLLFKNRQPSRTVFLEGYRKTGGYQGLKKALRDMTPAAVRQEVKASALRGRGGAGFSTGLKWSFFPADEPGDKYLVCNGDEMEPGTFKDRQLLLADPHHLLEGILIACYALGIATAYIFLRDAYRDCAANLERAMAEARDAGLLGDNILGSGFNCEIHLHCSAGRYVCGEETALLNSLEGRRPNPRAKPPFPAVKGLFGKPTALNNIETLANVPHIITGGADWYRGLALTEQGAGTKLYGLAGHIETPGCVELPIGMPLGELIRDFGGGVWQQRSFKACLPGGASTPYLTAAHLDVALDYDPLEQLGTRLGTGGVVVFDDRTCMVAATLNLLRFFARESCGWCTPCRDGLPLVCWLLERIESGQGSHEHLAMLQEQLRHINGRSFCALALGAMGPVEGLLRHFTEEVVDHIRRGCCPLKN